MQLANLTPVRWPKYGKKPLETIDRATLEQVEREHIVRVLRERGGAVTTAATSLGLHRTTLNATMRELGISRNDLRVRLAGRGVKRLFHHTESASHQGGSFANRKRLCSHGVQSELNDCRLKPAGCACD